MMHHLQRTRLTAPAVVGHPVDRGVGNLGKPPLRSRAYTLNAVNFCVYDESGEVVGPIVRAKAWRNTVGLDATVTLRTFRRPGPFASSLGPADVGDAPWRQQHGCAVHRLVLGRVGVM